MFPQFSIDQDETLDTSDSKFVPSTPFGSMTDFENQLKVMDISTEVSTIRDIIDLYEKFKTDPRNRAVEQTIKEYCDAFHSLASDQGKMMLYKITQFMSSLNNPKEA